MKWKPPYVFRGFWVKLFIASVRPVKLCCPTKLCILQLMKEEFCFTIWGRKIHPFDNNNNHVSAAQLRKYPKWKKKKKNKASYDSTKNKKSFGYYLGQTLVPDSVKWSLLKMVFGRGQTPGLGQLQHLQTLLTTLCHLLKPAQAAEGRRPRQRARELIDANL